MLQLFCQDSSEREVLLVGEIVWFPTDLEGSTMMERGSVVKIGLFFHVPTTLQ